MRDYFAQKRLEMVEKQLRSRGIKDPKLLESMNAVPRHYFVPVFFGKRAYEDTALPIGYNQTISQPCMIALAIQEAKLKSTDIVLEVGTGCGYAAAVLSRLVKKIYSIEFFSELASRAKKRLNRLGCSNVLVFHETGSIGFKRYAPFDAILVTGEAPVAPEALKEHLAIKGRLIIPGGEHTPQKLVSITRLDQTNFQEESLELVQYFPLMH